MKLTRYHIVSACFIFLLFLPLTQQLTGFLPVAKLAGVEKEAQPPTWNISSWLNKEFQQSVDAWFNTHVGLRPWMVRTAKQINYSLFDKEPEGTGTRVYIGRNNFLFEEPYITAYNEPGTKRQQLLHDITWGLWRFQQLLEQHGVAFLLVLAPSKAEIYPEFLPDKMKKSGREQRLSHYQRMLPILEKFDINYIDGHKLFLDWKKEGAPLLFSRGGTHWNYYAAGRIVQEMIANLSSRTGEIFDNIDISSYRIDSQPVGTDNDLGELLNLWFTDAITGEQVHPVFRHLSGRRRPDLLMIGDSFAFTLISIMEQEKLFDQCDLFYYFKRRFSWPRGTDQPLDFATLDLGRELLSRDAVIIEINEYWLPQYGFGILRPAIKALEDAGKTGKKIPPGKE
jgi:hypothetical protein